jgi:aspartyl-tRNA(Asn)/glutamyl-tRNA(Gln) amidotransferase subunit B
VHVDDAWQAAVRAQIPELPLSRIRRYTSDYALTRKEAAALVEERGVCLFFEQCAGIAREAGVDAERAGRLSANMVLQAGAKRANERSSARGAPVLVTDLGIQPGQVAAIVKLRDQESISAAAADELFGIMCDPAHSASDPAALAAERGMLIIRDDASIERWCVQAILDHPRAADDVRAGKLQAIGRLVGAVMKLSGGASDAADIRRRLLQKLGQG